MQFDSQLTEGTLIRRYKRFLADVQFADGRIETVHVPNTGSMLSTCAPQSPVALSYQPAPHRKLRWTLELLQVDGCWVGVNTGQPNKIVEEAINKGQLPTLGGYETLLREVKYGQGSRIDILLKKGADSRCYVEVKNVTYKVGRRALFPDAVTQRGARHLRELIQMVREGHRAVMLYLVNRDDCTSMGLARDIDPVYAKMLDAALCKGVEAVAYRVRNSLVDSVIDRKIRIFP